MTGDNRQPRLEQRLEDLSRELERVNQRLDALERGQEPRPAVSGQGAPPRVTAPAAAPGTAWGGMSVLFGHAAVVCFLLVAALVLRTLADSRLLTMAHGIWLGLGYAVLLQVVGWGLLRRRVSQGPVCSITGAVLLGAVLLEGVFRHQVVPTALAYGLLALVGGGTGWALRDRRGAKTLWAVGAVLLGVGGGLLLARPPFPAPVLLVLVGTAMAGRGSLPAGRSVFRGGAWLALMGVWAGWVVALGAALRSGAAVPAPLAPGWFGGMLLVTAGVFLVTTVGDAARRRGGRVSGLDAGLVPLTLGACHGAAVWVLPRLGRGTAGIGWVELGAAGGLFAVAWLLAGRREAGPTAADSRGVLVGNAAVLLVLGMPCALGGLAAVVGWAAAAYGLARLGQRWQSGGVRLAAYLLPLAGCGYGWLAPGLAPGGPAGGSAGLVFAAAALVAAVQYRWQRRQPVPAPSVFFDRFDRRDDTAALLLLAAVGYGLLAWRGGFAVLLGWFLAAPEAALASAQSIALSLAALALLAGGQRQGAGQVRGVGAGLLVVAAVRVFAFDLLTSRGLPLVGSVLAFGVAAGGAALALRRPPHTPGAGPLESGPGAA